MPEGSMPPCERCGHPYNTAVVDPEKTDMSPGGNTYKKKLGELVKVPPGDTDLACLVLRIDTLCAGMKF